MGLLLEVVVPLRWSGLPFTDDSTPLAWLGADGLELPADGPEPPPEALRFRFRTGMRMGDRASLERALDDATGSPENTNDLEVAFSALQAKIQARYEDRLWPEGRPKAASAEESSAQVRAINAALFDDLYRMASDDETDEEREARIDAATYDRVAQQRAMCRDIAEMSVLIEGPAEYRKWFEVEWDSIVVLDAVVDAYREARTRRGRSRGNVKRSAA